MSLYVSPLSKNRKTLELYFRDWEGNAFGFGYGTGELFTIPLIREFLSLCNESQNESSYDHEDLEIVLGKQVTWLMINIFGQHDIIEYGTSPRQGWLTIEGKRLRDFINTKNDEELYEITMVSPDIDIPNNHICYPDACNCGEHGHQKGVYCANPFWRRRIAPTKEELGIKDSD